MKIQNMLGGSWRDEGRVPPAVLFAGAWFVQSIISSRRAGPLSKAAGAVVGAASAALAATAAADFMRRGTSLDPLDPDSSELVTTGANAVSRHPMYVGFVGMLVGRAVSRRSMRALLPAAAVAVLLETRQIRAEEKLLAERFGPEFAAYKKRTPKWVDTRSLAVLRSAMPDDLGRYVPDSVRDKVPSDLPDTIREKVSAVVPDNVRDKLPEKVRDMLEDEDPTQRDSGPAHREAGPPRPGTGTTDTPTSASPAHAGTPSGPGGTTGEPGGTPSGPGVSGSATP